MSASRTSAALALLSFAGLGMSLHTTSRSYGSSCYAPHKPYREPMKRTEPKPEAPTRNKKTAKGRRR